jgi:hypothetical protein
MDHPPAAKRTLRATPELVPDDFDDATHARLDEVVLNGLKDAQLEYSPVLLLMLIVETSQEKLDPKYKSMLAVTTLIRTHPQLEVELKKAWEQEPKSFRNIRNLSTCGIIHFWKISSRRYRDSTPAFYHTIYVGCATLFPITSAMARLYRRPIPISFQIPVRLTGSLTISALARR